MISRLYVASIAPLYDTHFFEYAYNGTSFARRRKTDRYIKYNDKCLSIGTELLLKYALHEAGINTALDFEYGKNEKPYLKSHAVNFNLSHSGEYVLCALSDDEIGCDIEKIAESNEKIAKRFFTSAEYAQILSQPTREMRNDMFYRLWTLKESFIKATGLGMKLPLDSFEIVVNENIKLVHDDKHYFFKEFDCISGYKCAICSVNNCNKFEMIKIDLDRISEVKF